MTCPYCNHAFTPIPEQALQGFSGLWCKHCSKIFAIPVEIKEKVSKEKLSQGHPLKVRYKKLVINAKKRKIDILLTQEEFNLWWNNLPDICYYCGSTLDDLKYLQKKFYKTHRWGHFFSSLQMTVDRKDSSLGYLKSNLVKACLACNLVKGSIMTEQEALVICPPIINRLKNL